MRVTTFALASFVVLCAELVTAGVFIQGFGEQLVGCFNPVDSVTINTNGVCTPFKTRWFGAEYAGGGSQTCFIKFFTDVGCGAFIGTNVGPVDDVNLGGCVNPAVNNSLTGAESAMIIGCPT